MGQELKLGSPWLEDGPDDGQAEALFGGVQRGITVQSLVSASSY